MSAIDNTSAGPGQRPDATPMYPTFADQAAEVIWLQGELTDARRLLAYQSERLRLRADLWEAHQELDLLHARESARRGERISELERELARVIAQGGIKSGVMNRARLVLGGADGGRMGQGADTSPPAPLTGRGGEGSSEIGGKLPAGVCAVRSAEQPFPHGRWSLTAKNAENSKERGGV